MSTYAQFRPFTYKLYAIMLHNSYRYDNNSPKVWTVFCMITGESPKTDIPLRVVKVHAPVISVAMRLNFPKN